MDQDTDILGVGVSASVPNCPRGRLMYYLDCVNSLLDLGDQYDTAKLRMDQDTNASGECVSSRIPNSPRGRLMYYLDCVNSLLDLSDQYDISKLRNFESSHLLAEADTDALISMCFLFAPDKLDKHVIFQDDSLCGNSLNKFHDKDALRQQYQISDTVFIGDKGRTVFKVMTYKRKWLLRNWINPMHFYSDRLERIATKQRIRSPSSAIQLQSINSDKSASETTVLLGKKTKRRLCCCTVV